MVSLPVISNLPLVAPKNPANPAGWAIRHITSIAQLLRDSLMAVLIFALFVSLSLIHQTGAAFGQSSTFSLDVLPVLSDRCFHCHGPDPENREADLRLDVAESSDGTRGAREVLQPGSPEESELWNRITSHDTDVVMPPPESGRQALTNAEIDTIRNWIEAGAEWGRHWSFEAPRRTQPPLPELHPIDSFIRDRLKRTELVPSPRAQHHTALRRLSLTLTGLSPTPEQLKEFLSDPSGEAWNAHIDRLLNSPQHAERMAVWWLDAARYSDSDGYQADATRQNWPWRDWVIEAFQENMPFDQFTIEQFAGDLLPEATAEQILATCFHRNHMTNGEGGRDPAESRVDYVIDRVNTMGTVWLGLTLGCAQCHSHKFDPISQKDYYALTAFFNSIDEDGRAGMNARPYLNYQSPAVQSQIDELQRFLMQLQEAEKQQRAAAESRFANFLSDLTQSAAAERAATWRIAEASATSSDGTEFNFEEQGILQTSGPTPFQDDYRVTLKPPADLSRVTGWKLEVFPNSNHVDGRYTRDGNGHFTLTNVRLLLQRSGSPTETEIELSSAVADTARGNQRSSNWDTRYAKIGDTLNDDTRNGWTTLGDPAAVTHTAVFTLEQPQQISADDRLVVVLRHRALHGNSCIARFRLSLTDERGETLTRTDGKSPQQELLATRTTPNAEITADLRKRLLDQFLADDLPWQQASARVRRAKAQLNELQNQAKPRSVMVLQQRDQLRDTFVLNRGVWNAHGEKVDSAVPAAILQRPVNNRLELAKWIVDRSNPLTARVIVNHLWQLMFGSGIVRTPDDFGLQGARPTHPQLLDWLAVELMESGWDLRHILKLIATSETFRQSSTATVLQQELDPENRLLSRSPRFRLPAWILRDNSLHVSGLLNPLVGGPPVKPWQPEGVWGEITMGRFRYEPTIGPGQYRRTVYAWWRRSIAPVFLFDSAQRRVCEVQIRRTNTPLQALTLLNSPFTGEAARALADLSVSATDLDTIDRLQQISLRVLSRELTATELPSLQQLLRESLAYYSNHPDKALRFISVGQQPATAKKAAETAAWMTAAMLMLNLDEAISSE